MNQTIAFHCKSCKHFGEVAVNTDSVLYCPSCHIEWGKISAVEEIFEHCPLCECRQFYTTKDFNQFMGCMIMLIGIVLVPFTYGLSLPVFALIDWIIHKKVPTVINCYRCGCEFRGFANKKKFKNFKHHIGLKYDKYR